MNNLALALSDRYTWLGDVADMDDAVRNAERAVALTRGDSPTLPNLPKYLTTYGSARFDRYSRTGKLADLEATIVSYQRAVTLTPSDAPDFTDYLHNLAVGLRARYHHTGNAADLETAILVTQQIDELATPPVAANLAGVLTSRGNLLSDRYASAGATKDLDDSLNSYRQAIELTPEGSPQRAEILNNLATGL